MQHVLGAVARQPGVVIEAGPSGVRRDRPTHVLACVAPNVDGDARQFEQIVPEPRRTQPSAPCFHERCERHIAHRLPVRAHHQRCAHRERTSAVSVLVRADQLIRGAVAFEHTRRAERMIRLGRDRNPAHAIRMRELRRLAEPDELRSRLQSVLDEDAGRIAARVLLDPELRKRRDGVARDARAFQRLSVGACDERRRTAPESPDRPDEDGIVGSSRIELLPCRPAFLGQDVGHVKIVWRIADRHGHDPFAGPFLTRKLGDPILDVADRSHAAERRKDALQSFPVHVGVAVDQARASWPCREDR